MANEIIKYRKNLIYDDQIIEVPVIDVKNDSILPVEDVIVKLSSVPDGVIYDNSSLDRGIYDSDELLWVIGYIGPKGEDSVSGIFRFKVTDNSKAPFNFTFSVESSNCENCEDKNTYCVVIHGLRCVDLESCPPSGLSLAEGTYDDDLDASNSGNVEIGDLYELSENNSYGLPPGHIKKRTI